eukprot:GFUD01138632.1.p1 GENE.GFUD01138632.1~~GFUD01138632.1.p1  ORF type:complete len:345 (+),score=59.26 GFUD01138632.1:232-1266(+)
MELRGVEEHTRPLVPSKADNTPAPTPLTDRKQSMNKRIILGLVISAAAAVLLVILLCVFLIDTSPPPPPDPGTSPPPGPGTSPPPSGPGVPWLSVSPKRPYSASVMLSSRSDTSGGVGGQLQLCSLESCCSTGRFLFTAPTVIYTDHHQSCNTFVMDKNQKMSIKVLNENPEKVQIDRFEMTLEDGATYQGSFTGPQKEQWSESFPLEVLDLTYRHQKTMIKVNIKNLKNNPRNAAYLNGTKIEMKRKGDNRTGCFTNPLPWPKEEGTVKLNDLETLGTCFTYSIGDTGSNLLVRYHEPSNTQFTVSKIKIISFAEADYEWIVRQPGQNEGDMQWINAEFDDDA